MPRSLDLDNVVELLESGTNIVTTRGELFGGGRRLGDSGRAEVLAACRRGGSPIYATGSSPGFITDALLFALLSMQRRVDSIEIEEFANLSRRNSPTLLFELMGFGQPLASFDADRSSYLLAEFAPPLAALAEAAVLPIDEWTRRPAPEAADRASLEMLRATARAHERGGDAADPALPHRLHLDVGQRGPELLAKARAEGRLWDIDTGHDLLITEPEAVADRLLRVASERARIVRP